jgi:hypothetical protein
MKFKATFFIDNKWINYKCGASHAEIKNNGRRNKKFGVSC